MPVFDGVYLECLKQIALVELYCVHPLEMLLCPVVSGPTDVSVAGEEIYQLLPNTIRKRSRASFGPRNHKEKPALFISRSTTFGDISCDGSPLCGTATRSLCDPGYRFVLQA